MANKRSNSSIDYLVVVPYNTRTRAFGHAGTYYMEETIATAPPLGERQMENTQNTKTKQGTAKTRTYSGSHCILEEI